jgi:glycine betaine/proline transport system ATP-binding protein
MKNGTPVGVLDMRKLVRALVPSEQSDDPESARLSG